MRMRGELELLSAMEIGDLQHYVPGDPQSFGVHVMAFIGSVGDESSDVFDFVSAPLRGLRSSSTMSARPWLGLRAREPAVGSQACSDEALLDCQELHAAISENVRRTSGG